MLAVHTRKTMTVAVAMMATILIIASAAFACTGYRGRFEVITPTGTVASEGGAVGAAPHTRCSLTTTGSPLWPADSAGVTARVQPGSCSNMAAGVYTITYLTDTVIDQTKVGPFLLGNSDCMNAPGGDPTRNATQGGIFLGTMVVDSNGSGETSLFLPTVPGTTSSDPAAPSSGDVCISNAGGSFGNAVPMKFL